MCDPRYAAIKTEGNVQPVVRQSVILHGCWCACDLHVTIIRWSKV